MPRASGSRRTVRRPYVRVTAVEPSFAALVKDFLLRPSGLRESGLGAAFIAFGALFLVWYFTSPPQPFLLFLSLAFLLFGAGWLLSPVLRATVAHRALRRGVRTTATVTDIFDSGRSRVTLDALSNGWAEGRRLVFFDGHEFEDRFATDAPGSRELKPGSEMVVLVDPETRRVTLELGRS
jgi:hypothetical protein